MTDGRRLVGDAAVGHDLLGKTWATLDCRLGKETSMSEECGNMHHMQLISALSRLPVRGRHDANLRLFVEETKPWNMLE